MDGVITFHNEFAHVRLELDDQGNGLRIKITDVRTGKYTYLDALELECIAWAEHKDLSPILDPSKTRWKSENEE